MDFDLKFSTFATSNTKAKKGNRSRKQANHLLDFRLSVYHILWLPTEAKKIENNLLVQSFIYRLNFLLFKTVTPPFGVGPVFGVAGLLAARRGVLLPSRLPIVLGED